MQDYIAWAFTKNSPFTEIFNQELRKLAENGIIKKLMVNQVIFLIEKVNFDLKVKEMGKKLRIRV